MYNVIIIGGNAAGCKAASRLNRLCSNYHITILEKKSFLSFSKCGLPLHASGELDDLFDLAKTSYGIIRDEKYFRDVKGVKVLTNTEVKELNEERKEVVCHRIDKDETFTLRYDALILATGSIPKDPVFSYPSSPFISHIHSPLDSENFRQNVQKGKVNKAVIIGGGFIGCEMMEALTTLWEISTVLIEKEKSLLPKYLDPEISYYLESCIKDKVKLITSTSVDKIDICEDGKPVVVLNDNKKIQTDYIFLCLGVKPDAALAIKSKIKVGKFGGILVDGQMRTNLQNIWAAGDCIEIKNLITGKPDYFSYGSLANRMGRVAADSIAGKPLSLKGAAGTFSLKLFNNIIGATGLTEDKARNSGFNVASVIGCWSDRPDYYPEAKNIFGKLVYNRENLRLLGLQLVGEGEVTRYIDVFSDLLSKKRTVKDLLNLEHGYTPAHSSPISPLNNLGYMAVNQECDGIKNFNPLLISTFNGIFVDVREPYEIESFPFSEKCFQIPLSNLRLKLGIFKLKQSIMFVCEKGPRSYEAARMFVNYGYKNISYLGGGNLLYSCCRMNLNHNLTLNPKGIKIS